MLSVAFSSALKDFVRPGRVITWFLIAVVIGFIGKLWVGFQPTQSVATYGQVMEILGFRILALASAVFGMQVLSAELEQKTVVYLLTRSISRSVLLAGRSLASFVAVSGASLMCWFAIGMGVLGPRAFQTPGFWMDAIVLLVGVAAYGVLFIFVSLILNKAMIYCLIFAFGWEAFVPNMPGDLFYISIYPYLKALTNHAPIESTKKGIMDVLSGQVTDLTVPVTASWIVLAGIIVGFAALGLWVFSQKEYLPREEAE